MQQPRWRRALRRELITLLALKGAALWLLWWLFFSPAHRTPVDAAATSRRLAVTPTKLAAPPALPAGGARRGG
jgi:hypothetical protein